MVGRSFSFTPSRRFASRQSAFYADAACTKGSLGAAERKCRKFTDKERESILLENLHPSTSDRMENLMRAQTKPARYSVSHQLRDGTVAGCLFGFLVTHRSIRRDLVSYTVPTMWVQCNLSHM